MELLIVVLFILVIMILMKISTVEEMLKKIQKELEYARHVVEKPPHKVKEKASLTVSKLEKKAVLKQETVQPKPSLNKQFEEKKEPVKKLQESKVQTLSMFEKLQKRFKDTSLEELFFGNIILKVAIVAFILGIGLFLKYSIDKDWIPIWGRVLIGIMVGISMLVGGIKMINNKHKLFSEGLFGGGIAVLYLSIFAAFALEGFMFISASYAYVAMIVITILAGLISVRFDAKSTAIFGLIGGFATPFLLSTGSGNIVGLLSYMLMLNLGVLFVSLHKKWMLLSWMAFGITALTALATVTRTVDDFAILSVLYTLFFVIYSIVPFINEIRKNEQKLEKSSLVLFWANFIVALLSFAALFNHYGVALMYYAVVSVSLAAYLLVYAAALSKKSLLMKNLFYIVLAQSIALLLITPAFIFDGASLTIVWAIESLMLLWISSKSKEATYALFALLGFAITVVRYVMFDLIGASTELSMVYENVHALDFSKTLAITSFFVLGSLFAAYKLLKTSEFDFKYMSESNVKVFMFIGAFIGAYVAITYLGFILTGYHGLSVFPLMFMSIIALFSFLLYKSDYGYELELIYTVFIFLMSLSFLYNILHINMLNTFMSLINFLVFMAIVGFIYNIAFKKSELTVSTHKLSDLMISAGIMLLFVFLNVELYHVVQFYSPGATKFAMTLLWVIFGIVLFVFGALKARKALKIVGTALILLGILKAFFFDLANLDSIYRILLFLLLGAILFGLSYFYQNRQEKDKLEREEIEKEEIEKEEV